MTPSRSRLSRKLQKDSQKTFLISILGIILVVILLFKFGVPFLVNLTLFISQIKGQKDQGIKEKSNGFLAAPILDALPSATNSGIFKISGSVNSKSAISLYVNNELIDKKDSTDKGTFVFTDVKLSKGENTIKTKASDGKKESEFSNDFNIAYKDKAPTLTIDSPSEGQKFEKENKSVSISGKTESGVKVTINGLWAIVESNGNFTYNLPLQNGDNNIKIIATDEAGNNTEVNRKVTYSP